MEQARYWMWPKRKLDLMNSYHLQHFANLANPAPSNDDLWEEQAFAEDASGALGGCVWPPRSYTCSFCKREFRSAQALGGHMNVHRRDRARLKQSCISDGEGGVGVGVSNTNNHGANPVKIPLKLCSKPNYTTQYGSQSSCGAVVYNHNSDSDNWIRVSTKIQEQNKNNYLSAAATRCFCLIPDLKNNGENNKDLKVVLDLRKSTIANDEAEDSLKILDSSCRDHKEASSCKRRRKDANPPFRFFKPGSEILRGSMEELELNLMEKSVATIRVEELDLELRLGDSPKVK